MYGGQFFPKEIDIFIDELFFIVEERTKVGEFKEVKFVVNTNEHNPPHVHCKYDKYEIKISLVDFSVIYQSHDFPPKRLKFAQEWVKENKDKLLNDWKRYTNLSGYSIAETSYLEKTDKYY